MIRRSFLNVKHLESSGRAGGLAVGIVKTITMKKLRRTNDGYEAMTKSFQDFITMHQRRPLWTELINHMLENAPDGIIVSGKKKRNRIVELTIEGLEKPIDRDAFQKRFIRYFPQNGH